MYFNRLAVDSNTMLIEMKYSTMNIEINEEKITQNNTAVRLPRPC